MTSVVVGVVNYIFDHRPRVSTCSSCQERTVLQLASNAQFFGSFSPERPTGPAKFTVNFRSLAAARQAKRKKRVREKLERFTHAISHS